MTAQDLLLRLPRLLPDATPTEALPPALIVGDQIYLASEGPFPVSAHRDQIKVPLNVTPRQTARGATWASGSRKPKPVTMQVRFRVEGINAWDVGTRAARWHALALSATEYAEGASSVGIKAVLDHEEPYGEGNSRSFSVTYLLADPWWRLDPLDPSPKPNPVAGVAGNYPLGLLRVTDVGEGTYEVEALAGVRFGAESSKAYSYPDATFTYSHLLEVVDDQTIE
ncbi:hypothetical protein QR90_06785 [Deinococcus radiopugnans]|uniref:Uncharacterized protein n=1 Tax=Deinococcus radiopugnans TaxID=57497 RepID=A0A0A7KI57_9DEIO|nr:hypothetical protein [Deinococcus radiopugnans]AIZ44874.1 hypothetical protein QR90_06785 [Deinococcus radiopugnans]